MPTKLRNNNFTMHGIKEPGDFAFDRNWDARVGPNGEWVDYLCVVVPGCKFNMCCIRITTGPAVHPVWHWDGNREAPTLTPSVGCDQRCGKHFVITAGMLAMNPVHHKRDV